MAIRTHLHSIHTTFLCQMIAPPHGLAGTTPTLKWVLPVCGLGPVANLDLVSFISWPCYVLFELSVSSCLSDGMCTEVQSDGFWHTVPCTPPKFIACRNTSSLLTWTVVPGTSTCPSGFIHATPMNGRQNHSLYVTATLAQLSTGIRLTWVS